MSDEPILAGAEPFFFKGNDIGVLVCHGFTGTTQSMRYLGEQLHDAGYTANFPDLPFQPAAFLLTRVVSRPRRGRITLDLGSKAVASDPPAGHRVTVLDLPDGVVVGQSEEHLVVETAAADQCPPGTVMLAVPTHICPTCALHREAIVVEDGRVVDRWAVTARDRTLGV